MLKNFLFRKIIVTVSFCLAVFMVYLFPVNTNNNELKVETQIKYVNASSNLHPIYLIDKDGYVAQTKVMIEGKSVEEKTKEMIDILTIDSRLEHLLPSKFKAIIPKNAKLISLTYKDNLIKLNFNEKFWNVRDDMQEKLVEAIVYSLTEIEGIDNVMIFVGQDIISKIPSSNTALPSVLNRSIGVNKKSKINKRENIKGVTVYYTKKLDDETYFVPVTKYMNDTREKINIIIEELASTTTYEPTLISYLDTNTKLIDSKIENNIISLNFNSAIMSNIDNNKILEEVTQVISLSVKDNYDLDEVIYLVDNKQVTKNCLKGCEIKR